MGYYLNVKNGNIICCSNDDITSETIKSYPVSEEVYYNYMKNEDRYIFKDGEIVEDETWAEREKQRREADFNKQFFSTSLGYIRRKVTMQFSDEIKDFLSDLLPTISMGVSAGTEVKILAYEKPSFDEDVEDWTKYQKQVVVTPAFIQECFAQLQADFGVLNV